MAAPNDNQVQSTVARDIDWARHHLLVMGLAAVLAIVAIYGVLNIIAKSQHDQWQQMQGVLGQMQKQNDQTQASTKAEIDALAKQNEVLEQQFSAVMQSIAARDAQLVKDRSEIKSLPPSALATKWGAAANEPAPVIQANGDFDAPLPLAQKSYDALLQVPVLTKDNSDLKVAVSQKTQEAANNQTKFDDEKKAHDSDSGVCKQTIDTKNQEIKTVKAEARKNHIIVAIVSVAIGFLLHR